MVEQPHGGALKKLAKGETSNPHGRPPGVKSFRRILKELMKQETTIEDISGMTLKLTNKEAAMLLLVRDATDMEKDENIRMKAVTMIMEKIDGKPKQKTELSGPGGKDLIPESAYFPKQIIVEIVRNDSSKGDGENPAT